MTILYSLTLGATLTSFTLILTLQNANATSVAIYTCKSSNCNSTMALFTAITIKSSFKKFIIIANKVVLTAKTSDEV